MTDTARYDGELAATQSPSHMWRSPELGTRRRVPPFDTLPQVAADPGKLRDLLRAPEDSAARTSPLAYGKLIKHMIPEEVFDSYVLPSLRNPEILRDAAKVWSSARSEPVHEAGRRLIAGDGPPVLFAWSREDSVFPVDHARRFAAELAQGHVKLVTDAYAFAPEDQPAQLAQIIGDFASPSEGSSTSEHGPPLATPNSMRSRETR